MGCPRRRAGLDTKHKSQRYDEIGQWHAWELTRSISHGPTSPPQNLSKPRRTLQTDQQTRGKLTSIRRMQTEHELHYLPSICTVHSSLLQNGFQRMGAAGVVLHTHEPGAEKLEWKHVG